MRKLLTLLIGFLFPLLFNSPAFAIKLEGRVTNQVNGTAIAGASIQLLKDGRATEYRTATDYDGRFAIINLPKGTYDVVIFHPEYIKKRIRGVEVESNQITTFSRSELAVEPTPHVIVNEKTPSRVNEIYHSKSPKAPINPRPQTKKNGQKSSPTVYLGPRGQVKGQVLEKKTKAPAIGARVRLLLTNGTSARMGAITDYKGNFLILNVPPAVYDVEISYGPTYTKQIIKQCIVAADRAYETGVILLSKRPVEPDTVYVNGHHSLILKR